MFYNPLFERYLLAYHISISAISRLCSIRNLPVDLFVFHVEITLRVLLIQLCNKPFIYRGSSPLISCNYYFSRALFLCLFVHYSVRLSESFVPRLYLIWPISHPLIAPIGNDRASHCDSLIIDFSNGRTFHCRSSSNDSWNDAPYRYDYLFNDSRSGIPFYSSSSIIDKRNDISFLLYSILAVACK